MSSTANLSPSATLPAKGERFKCDVCGMEIELVTGCKSEQGQPQFICCGRPLTPLGQSYLAQTKEAFVRQMQTAMDRTKGTITWLREEAARAKDSAQEDLTHEAEFLSVEYQKVREALSEVKNAHGDAWHDVAEGCSEAWQRFKSGCEKAASRYRGKP